MAELIVAFLTGHASEIIVGVIIAGIVVAVTFSFKKIKHGSYLAWAKIKRIFLDARPKLYRSLGVVPIEDMQALVAETRRTVSAVVSPAVSPSEMIFQDNVFWSRSNDGLRESPFCPKCYGGDRKEVRLTEYVDDRFWRCQVCNIAVEKPGQGSRPNHAETEFDPYAG